MPMASPTKVLRCSPWMLWPNWLPTTGNCPRAESRTERCSAGWPASTMLSSVTSTSSSGNRATNAE